MNLVLMIICSSLIAGILQGITGFGAGIVMMVFLPLEFHLAQSAGISTAICIFICLSMVYRYRLHINFKQTILPAILYLIVSSIAISFSIMVDQALMKKVFGIFMIILSIYYLFFNKQEEESLSLPIKILCIVISGICDGLFGIGGPLMVLYFLNQTHTKEEYLGTIQCFFAFITIYNTIFRVFKGILVIDHIMFIGIGIIGILTGLAIANKIVDRMNNDVVKKVTYVVIGISGIINLI